MPATTPPSGTPDQGPDKGEVPASTGEDPGGAPGPGQDQALAGERRAAGDGYGDILSELAGAGPSASRRRKRRLIVVSAALFVVATVAGLLVTGVFDYTTAGVAVSRVNEKQKEYDASQQPFVTSVRPVTSEPATWVMVLERELTARETRTMTSKKDSSAAFSYLRSLGGRPLAHAPLLEHAPPTYEDTHPSGHLELADIVKMSVLSTRAYAVVIDGWEVVDVRCRKSTAKTVVAFPPQGGAAYEGVRLHIPPRADEPVLTDDMEGQGEPYFQNRYIEVGGGQSSGGLRIEAIAPHGQSCEWGVKVHYTDAHQNSRTIRLKDRNGDPLRIRTESVPANPRQKWVFGSVPWTPCHERPKGPLCDLV